jgi:molybdopterin/thiamine biosynthesis adenylyltransferase/proteasome lid subunit RPN8/RPN11
MTGGQRQALDELFRVASVNRALQVVDHRTADDGTLVVQISIDCSNIAQAPAGIRLRARERLVIHVAADFPFTIPVVLASHGRWAGTPHVQWGRQLCLYVSPATEWDPSDGMAGFVERLVLWLERASAGQLDGVGEPMHPPVAYWSRAGGQVVVRANAPRPDGDVPWLGVAVLRQIDDGRVDALGWRGLMDQWPSTLADAREAAGLPVGGEAKMVLAFAVVLPRPIAFEYPATASELFGALRAYGLDEASMLGVLGTVCRLNRDFAGLAPSPTEDGVRLPLYLLVGTPGRGVVGDDDLATHLAAWRLPDLAADIARLIPHRHSSVAELASIGNEVLAIGRDWLQTAPVDWARVHEARPEVVVPRDRDTSASWLVGKKVLILGAGALGAPIADACVRGRAARVVIADNATVHPGILARQPYDDEDIGRPKALVLAKRLRQIGLDVEIEPFVGEVASTMFDDGAEPPGFDLIVDATANRIVRTVIERRRAAHRDAWPPLATVLIGHDARRGIATLSHRGASGGGADILRRLSLAGRGYAIDELSDVVEDFFPDPPRSDFFQPEPGCSEATFVGSAADITGLAGQLLTGVLNGLTAADPDGAMLALVVRMPGSPHEPPAGPARWFNWPSDVVVAAADGDYEVRLAAAAVAEMRAEARRGARIRGPNIETGGTLLGAFDAAAGVVWVDEATAPPPDSRLADVHFEHGVDGVDALIASRAAATARVTTFVGMWHSHPYGKASPSDTDEDGMHDLVLPVVDAPPRALLLIVGGPQRWEPWRENGTPPDWYGRVVTRALEPGPVVPKSVRPNKRDIEWWPGGSRPHGRDRRRVATRSRFRLRWWKRRPPR